MRSSLYILILLIATFGCTEEPFNCTCNTSFVNENDSIVQSARLDSSIIKLDKRYNQELLEKRDTEAYRIYIRHSLNRYFQVYTLVKNNDGAILEVQEYKGSSGYSLDNKLDTSYLIDSIVIFDKTPFVQMFRLLPSLNTLLIHFQEMLNQFSSF